MAFTCKYCKREFRAKQQMQQHELIHEGKKYQCDICGQTLSNLGNLSRHKNLHPFSFEKNTTTMFSLCGADYICGECKKVFSKDKATEYHAHLEEHREKSDYGKIKYAKK